MSLVRKKENQFQKPILPAFGIVAALEEDDRRLLSNYGEFFPIQADHTVIVEGEEQNALYYVISGMLHVYTQRGNRVNTTIGRVGAGESLGEVNLFDPYVASANVVAEEFSQVWRCTRGDLEAFLNTYHEAGSRLLIGLVTNMSQRLRQMNERYIGEESLGDAAKMWT